MIVKIELYPLEGEKKSRVIISRGRAKKLIQRNNQMNKKALVISFCLRIRDYYLLIDQTTGWFQIGKEYIKAVYCHPVYLIYMQSTSC